MPYSGTLNDGGAPIDGIVNMRISPYETEGDEIPIWFETHDGVQINGGQFNLNLFSQTDINDDDLGLQQIYVGISINDGSE